MPKASRWGKIKAANLQVAVVVDLLQNFASRPKNEQWSIRYNIGLLPSEPV